MANYYANDTLVDPIKNAHISSGKSMQSFEKNALRVRKMWENGEKLNRRERLTLFLYRIASKYRLLSEMADETHARYAAEQAAKEIAAETEEYLTKSRTTATVDASTEAPQ